MKQAIQRSSISNDLVKIIKDKKPADAVIALLKNEPKNL